MIRKSCEAGHSLAPRVAAVAVMVVAMNVAWQEIQYQLQPEREAELIRAREAVIRANLYQMRSCIDQHLADKGYYPSSLQTLVDERYLRSIPADPFSGMPEGAWKELGQEYRGGNHVTDVQYAGDTRVALDGTLICKW